MTAGVVGAVKPLATNGVDLLCPFGCCQTFALIVQKSLCGREAFHWRHAKPSVTRIPTETSVPDGLSANPEEQGDWLRLEGRGRRGSHGQHRAGPKQTPTTHGTQRNQEREAHQQTTPAPSRKLRAASDWVVRILLSPAPATSNRACWPQGNRNRESNAE
jgi:hypothetical protein